MLRLAKVRPGGENYYLSTTLAGGSGGDGLVEPDGDWSGRGAELLGVEGAVAGSALRSLLRGFDPATGELLDPRHGRVRVAAYDATFAAPKSVSVLHALAPGDVVAEVRQAHERAVAGALGYLERNAAYVRRGALGQAACGFVAAGFVHRTSRALDPHLHSHLLLANLARGDDGRWTAVDGRPLYAHVGPAGALYRAGLRHELAARLGVVWSARGEGFADLIGIPGRALRGFSRRTAEIAAELERAGGSGEHARRIAAERTRPAKDSSRDYPTLVSEWRERAFQLGLGSQAVSRAAPGVGRAAEREGKIETRVADAAAAFERSFGRRDLVRASCTALRAGAPAAAIEQAVASHIARQAVPAGIGQLRLTGRAGRFPAGLSEERFSSPEVAALTERVQKEIAAAPVVGAGCRKPPAGAVVRLAAATVEEGYEIAGQLARSVDLAAVCLSATARAAAHFEAATGLESASWEEVGQLRRAMVVLDDPQRCRPRRVVELLDRAARQELVVVFAERRGSNAPSIAAAPPGRCFEFGARVMVVDDLRGAVGEIERRAISAGAAGLHPLVVTAEPAMLKNIACPALRPGSLARALDVHPHRAVVVFGSARLLGGTVRRIADAERTHVVVAPTGGIDERSFALGVAEPAWARQALGRSPEGAAERARWRTRAESLERRREEPGIEVARRIRLIEGRGRVGFGRSIG